MLVVVLPTPPFWLVIAKTFVINNFFTVGGSAQKIFFFRFMTIAL
jgi:hypothetical protein